mgnify:CR=1 FL=1
MKTVLETLNKLSGGYQPQVHLPVVTPINELCDRLTIAILKYERLPPEELEQDLLKKQIRYYANGLTRTDEKLMDLLDRLYTINGEMWDAEHAIRQGLDDNLGLEEIGRRAIQIRDKNRVRVAVKNEIADYCGQSEFLDCKMNHISDATK